VRWKSILLWAGLGGATAAGAYWLAPLVPSDPARPASADVGKQELRERPAENRWAELPRRETLGMPAGEIFVPHSWTPPAPVQSPSASPKPAAKPAPPPVPYRVAGKLRHEGRPQIVLAKGDAILAVREGDTLDDGYRVVSIRRDHVTLLYVPLGLQQTLPIDLSFVIDEPVAAAAPDPEPHTATVAAEASPARLRWAGPEQVKAGDPFTVALKVSSGQAVRAVPLQLSYDAALLEPVDVRPGKFFADGLFSYRINPGGSIFVGASGKETLASDAELLVVTFKPIRAGVVAELKISSMMLQSGAGRTIAHDQPAAFRTAVVR
jgi:hypothetical protein